MKACRASRPAQDRSRAPVQAATTPRLAVPLLLALLLCGSRAEATAYDFGSPPSREVPILYNDHAFYAKPDLVKQGRLLAALVKNRHIYPPLRRMFEQLRTAVFISADDKTVVTVKDKNSISLTVGQDNAVINGATRPLDVPPILYKGIVLVPVRILFEALGAYVQWVPDRRVVVVRYVPPAQPSFPGFVEAAPAPQPFNEFTNGHWCRGWLCCIHFADLFAVAEFL